MASQPSQPQALESLKATALRLKEKQLALEARAKELEALEARLKEEQEGLEKQRAEFEDARKSSEGSVASLDAEKEKLQAEEQRLKQAAVALADRENAVRVGEERIGQMDRSFRDDITGFEERFRGLVERQVELLNRQNEWLGAFDARSKELATMAEAIRQTQAEVTEQRDAFADLKVGIQDELNRLLAEEDKLAVREKDLLEAQRYIVATLEAGDVEPATMDAPAIPSPEPAPEVLPEALPAPDAKPEAAAPAVVVEAAKPTEEAPRPAPTRADAMDRLAQAVDAWKRTRAAGGKVIDIRDQVRAAREAVAATDYEGAIRIAAEIVDGLRAALPAQ